MSTLYALQTVLETIIVIALIIGMFYEEHIAIFERKLFKKIVTKLRAISNTSYSTNNKRCENSNY